MSNEELRLLILRILRAVGSIGDTAEGLKAQISAEDKEMTAARIAESCQYLIDRDLVREKRSQVSGLVRLRIAPDGLDLLEEEGI